VDAIHGWTEEGWRVVLAASSLSSADRLRHLLGEYGIGAPLVREPAACWSWSAPGRVEVRVAPLSAGFALPLEHLAVVTEEEIFGPRERRRQAAALREGAAVDALAQLAPGDLLVHAEHGIGIYRGLVMLEVGSVRSEMLRLEYEAGDRLFLPVHRLNLVQRYVGGEGPLPRIDRLGGATWERTKRSVRKSVRRLARELLAVHAARELAPGHSFSPRDRHLEEFEAAFPFEETPDQLAAIEDVLGDLTRQQPMDRLVCGDVGYGKTEVAIRAAFRVVMDGKQVAVLVPTTVLCQQHLETFRARFDGHPIAIESLSRFRSPKEANAVLEGLAGGRVDIIIGTHRLLQKHVEFRDLGLLVVDEEHRFGVAHKERIKQLKKTVDVLTLTATPIPRTLQMAFTGLRDLSIINTPPPDRLAIRTQVCRFDESLIREAILREVRRGGQVFFVHNRVQTIGTMAELIERLVPEVKIIVGHGQLGERELEKRMLAFLRGEADVLLCTTIIESGLDIPRANTMIIDRADALGLAQLYQLRGRVGRSSHRAYAYLLIPGEDALTRDAERRLEAIQDLAELGSGFRLANMDLEIRGAGNLLGEEQSGNLGAVGYETYMELLEETIDEMRGQARPVSIDPEIRLPVTAQLPEGYVAEVSQRLVLYKRLASAPDEADLARTRDELLDRYGPLPPEADNLIGVLRVKLAAREAGVTSVDLERGELALTVGPFSRIEPARLARLVSGPDARLRVAKDQRLRASAPSREPGLLLGFARETLEALLGDADGPKGDPLP
jgi:transcription-repair coupling factor (superfamily II helicase)